MELSDTLMRNSILGFIIGDALGVPVEFSYREELRESQVTDMIGNGTHLQPKGTWSDDTSMILATMQAIINGYSLEELCNQFIRWGVYKEFTPHGEIFDIGGQVKRALNNMINGVEPLRCGGTNYLSNGNGSLMRILPFIFSLSHTDNIIDRYKIVAKASKVTHGHIISQVACFIYEEMGRLLIKTHNTEEAYRRLCESDVSIIANKELGECKGKFNMIVENYPDLKASEQFSELQAQLEGTENRIAVARKDYNTAVTNYNTYRKSFFVNIFFSSKYPDKELFKASEESKVNPTVSFDK